MEFTGTRRDVLRRGVAAIGAATIVGNAGCIGQIGSGGGYTQWLPEPGTVQSGDHYSFSKVNYSALAEHKGEFSSDTDFQSIEATWAPADIDWEDVSMALRFRGMLVVDADFETDRILDDFEDEDFEEDDEYEGHTVLLGPNERAAVGVDDGTLVGAGLGFGAVDAPQRALEDVIDASNGDADRYEDDSDDFAELTDKLGDGHIVSGSTSEPTDADDPERGQFRDQVGAGRRLDVDGSTTDGTWVHVYESENDVDVGDVEDWIDENDGSDGQFSDWDDVEVEAKGRSVVITATADTDDL